MTKNIDSLVLQGTYGQIQPGTLFHLTRSVTVNGIPDPKSDLLPSLIWPITLIVILITFRKSISGLIPRITSAEGAGWKFTFAQVAANIEKNTPQPAIVASAAAIAPQPTSQDVGSLNKDVQKSRVAIGELSRTNPKAALIKIYDDLIQCIEPPAKKRGWTTESGVSATQFLANTHILTPENLREIMILTSLRSQADLYPEGAFQESDAVSYATRAYPIIDRLALFK